MKIAFGSDHAGFWLKEKAKGFVEEMGHEALDLGTTSADSVDYPDFARAVAETVKQGRAHLGVLVCGTGLGMAICANKVPGIRAVTCCDTLSARMSRQHNNSNVLCLGARIVGEDLALDVLSAWLGATFEGGRHERRIGKIADVEKEYMNVVSGGNERCQGKNPTN